MVGWLGRTGADYNRLPSTPPSPFTEENVLENARWPVNYCSTLFPRPSLQNLAGAAGGGAPAAGSGEGERDCAPTGDPTAALPVISPGEGPFQLPQS